MSSSLEYTPDLFPELPKVPLIVRRIFFEAQEWYKTGTLEPLTQQKLSDRLLQRHPDLPGSLSVVERALRNNRQWLRWPIPEMKRAPWETEPEPKVVDGIVDPVPVRLQSADRIFLSCEGPHGETLKLEGVPDDRGVVQFFLHLRDGLLSLTAASITMLILLDGMDGHVDSVIHWCIVLAQTQVIRG